MPLLLKKTPGMLCPIVGYKRKREKWRQYPTPSFLSNPIGIHIPTEQNLVLAQTSQIIREEFKLFVSEGFVSLDSSGLVSHYS